MKTLDNSPLTQNTCIQEKNSITNSKSSLEKDHYAAERKRLFHEKPASQSNKSAKNSSFMESNKEKEEKIKKELIRTFMRIRESLSSDLSAAKIVGSQTNFDYRELLSLYHKFESDIEKEKQKVNPLYSKKWKNQCFKGYHAGGKKILLLRREFLLKSIAANEAKQKNCTQENDSGILNKLKEEECKIRKEKEILDNILKSFGEEKELYELNFTRPCEYDGVQTMGPIMRPRTVQTN
ncbi:hypothetical protein [Gardnerella sp. KA00255]|uniref:hypothetical protein n=1 Tax=Gardnerella sp. KA00255 TaxID=2749073 RepID=UPI003BAA4F8C